MTATIQIGENGRIASCDARLYPDGVHYVLEGREREIAERFVEKNARDEVDVSTANGKRRVPFFDGVDGVLPVNRGGERAAFERSPVFFLHGVSHGYYCLEDGTCVGEEDGGIGFDWQEALGVDELGRPR